MNGGLQSPYAAWLPPLSTAEKDALRQSIEADGVLVPIEVDERGNILDGHHRHAIARELGREAPTRVLKGLTEGQREAHVNSSNRDRRNMSPDQKAALRKRDIEIAQKLNAEGFTQEQIAGELKVARETVRDWLTTNGGSAKASKRDSRVKLSGEDKVEVHERIGARDAQAQVAADLGVSQQRVSQVHKAEKKRLEREADLERQNADIRAMMKEGGSKLRDVPLDVVAIDPPWPYGNEKQYDPIGFRGTTPYPEMPLEEIGPFVTENVTFRVDCVLWLWTTHKFLRHCFPLLDAWGFEEKVTVTWDKKRMGTGRWLRSQSEFCILAVRGSPKITLGNQTTMLEGKPREHSRKPEEFYALVDSLCPGEFKREIFGREQHKGWLPPLGNEPDKFEVAND